MTQDNTGRVAILVSSCDEFSDAWHPFFELFFRNWHDCPYTIYLNTVSIPFHYPGVNQILVGSRQGWGDGLLKGLEQLQRVYPSEYILLLLDDYLLNGEVDNGTISQCIEALDALNGNYLRLVPKPPPARPVEGYGFLGEIDRGAAYRLSLQASIWKTETIISLLRPTDTPWDMELIGSDRANIYPGFYCTYQPVIRYLNGIERGKWDYKAANFLIQEGISIDLSRRDIAEPLDETGRTRGRYLRQIKKLIPLRARLGVRKIYARLVGKHIQ